MEGQPPGVHLRAGAGRVLRSPVPVPKPTGLGWLRVLPGPVLQLQPGHQQLPGTGGPGNPVERESWWSPTGFLQALPSASARGDATLGDAGGGQSCIGGGAAEQGRRCRAAKAEPCPGDGRPRVRRRLRDRDVAQRGRGGGGRGSPPARRQVLPSSAWSARPEGKQLLWAQRWLPRGEWTWGGGGRGVLAL